MIRRFGIVVALLGLWAAATAQADEIPKLAVVDVSESYNRSVPISGTGVVGSIYYSESDRIDPDALYVFVGTSGPERKLEAKMSSADGVYRAKLTFNVPRGFTGWAQVVHSGGQKYRIRRYSIEDFAVVISDGSEIYLARWGTPAKTGNARVTINSERADSFFAIEENGRKKKRGCKKAKVDQPIRFDKQCVVPLDQMASRDGKLEIRRKSGITPLASIWVDLDQ